MTPLPVIAGVPGEALTIIWRAISAPGGASAGEIGDALGKTRETARTYLKAMAAAGSARCEGKGRAARWFPAARPPLTVIKGDR